MWRACVLRAFVGLVLVLLAALGCKGLFEKEERSEMKQTDISVWQAIEVLVKQIPFSKQKVEEVLSTQLTEVEEGFNKLFHFYKGEPIGLAEGVVISGVDLRIRREAGHPGFLVLEISGAAISLQQVQSRYAKLEITQAPRGRSAQEQTSFTQAFPWGKLSFGFKEQNRNGLASIAFEPA